MTAKAARIRVEVGPAALAFEREATFTAEGKLHAIIVDAQDLHGDLLRVDPATTRRNDPSDKRTRNVRGLYHRWGQRKDPPPRLSTRRTR